MGITNQKPGRRNDETISIKDHGIHARDLVLDCTELGRTNSNVVARCADLIGSLKMDQVIGENPDRFFQVGIAEVGQYDGNCCWITIGGKIPFTGTANVSTGRVYDQIRQSIAYSGKNVKILCFTCWCYLRRRQGYPSNFRGHVALDENAPRHGGA